MMPILLGEYMPKTERVNLVMPTELYNFLLKMVESGLALNVSDAVRKCILYYKTRMEEKQK